MNHLPRGMRFLPTDQEIISYYLTIKVRGFPPPVGMNDLIPLVNFYGHSPQELIGMHDNNVESEEWYFLTEMEGTGRRTSRKAKGGFWKTTAKDKPVYDHVMGSIGHKRALDFYQDGKRTEYKMHEYTTLTPPIESSTKMKYWVVNKIYMNKHECLEKKRRTRDDCDHCDCDSESTHPAKKAEKDGEVVTDHVDITFSNKIDEEKDDQVNHPIDGQADFNLNDVTNYEPNHFGCKSLEDDFVNLNIDIADCYEIDGDFLAEFPRYAQGYMPDNVFATHPDHENSHGIDH